jgi:hypothetical protein
VRHHGRERGERQVVCVADRRRGRTTRSPDRCPNAWAAWEQESSIVRLRQYAAPSRIRSRCVRVVDPDLASRPFTSGIVDDAVLGRTLRLHDSGGSPDQTWSLGCVAGSSRVSTIHVVDSVRLLPNRWHGPPPRS